MRRWLLIVAVMLVGVGPLQSAQRPGGKPCSSVGVLFGVADEITQTWQFFERCGGPPLAGGSVRTFQVGSGSVLSTWRDGAFVEKNPNPVRLDTKGRAVIVRGLGLEYRFVLFDARGRERYALDLFGDGTIRLMARDVVAL